MRVHFVGIGGISMSGLALYLIKNGYDVSGSDISQSAETDMLARAGAKIYIGHNKENIAGAEAVIYNSAISEENEELKFARENKKFILTRAELLGLIGKNFKKVLAVCGSHGKTTATCMLTYAFVYNRMSPTSHIGGSDMIFKNFLFGGEEYFITEACEYKGNFLKLSPSCVVLLNIDYDHSDYFKNIEHVQKIYKEFVEKASDTLIINADDYYASQLRIKNKITFAINNPADYVAKEIKEKNGVFSFNVYERGKKQGRIKLGILGKHNIYNALAAFAAARYYGLESKKIIEGLSAYRGIARRSEKLGFLNGAVCYADYAHHPKEIAASIESFKILKRKKIYVVFQPHTYSRTKMLINEFVSCFNMPVEVIIYKTYAAREKYDEEGSAFYLYKKLSELKKCYYHDDMLSLKKFLCENAGRNDLILFLGAGDIYFLAKNIIEAKGER